MEKYKYNKKPLMQKVLIVIEVLITIGIIYFFVDYCNGPYSGWENFLRETADIFWTIFLSIVFVINFLLILGFYNKIFFKIAIVFIIILLILYKLMVNGYLGYIII